MNNGRPKPCADIYKNGRLKNKTEMAADRERIALLDFDDLVDECIPLTEKALAKVTELTEGVEVDMDEPLNPDDD